MYKLIAGCLRTRQMAIVVDCTTLSISVVLFGFRFKEFSKVQNFSAAEPSKSDRKMNDHSHISHSIENKVKKFINLNLSALVVSNNSFATLFYADYTISRPPCQRSYVSRLDIVTDTASKCGLNNPYAFVVEFKLAQTDISITLGSTRVEKIDLPQIRDGNGQYFFSSELGLNGNCFSCLPLFCYLLYKVGSCSLIYFRVRLYRLQMKISQSLIGFVLVAKQIISLISSCHLIFTNAPPPTELILIQITQNYSVYPQCVSVDSLATDYSALE